MKSSQDGEVLYTPWSRGSRALFSALTRSNFNKNITVSSDARNHAAYTNTGRAAFDVAPVGGSGFDGISGTVCSVAKCSREILKFERVTY